MNETGEGLNPTQEPPQSIAGENIGTKILPDVSMPGLPEVSKAVLPDLGLSPQQKASLGLVKWVMLGGFTVLLILILGFFCLYPCSSTPCAEERQRLLRELTRGDLSHGENLELLSKLTELNEQEVQNAISLRKDFFQSWLEMVKTIILITIVPILTSLLGYTFGNQSVK